jgi:hypothetical protein
MPGLDNQRPVRRAGVEAQRSVDHGEGGASPGDHRPAPEKAKRIAGTIAASIVVPCD